MAVLNEVSVSKSLPRFFCCIIYRNLIISGSDIHFQPAYMAHSGRFGAFRFGTGGAGEARRDAQGFQKQNSTGRIQIRMFGRRQPLYRLYQRTSQPHEYQPQNETQTDVKTEVEPVFLLQEQIHVVGKRRKGGETAAEAGDQEDVHRR